MIPNSVISSKEVVNFTAEDKRRQSILALSRPFLTTFEKAFVAK